MPSAKGKYGSPFANHAATANNTYKALRIIGDRYNLLPTGGQEFYDITKDTSQMHDYFDLLRFERAERWGDWP